MVQIIQCNNFNLLLNIDIRTQQNSDLNHYFQYQKNVYFALIKALHIFFFKHYFLLHFFTNVQLNPHFCIYIWLNQFIVIQFIYMFRCKSTCYTVELKKKAILL